MRRPAPIQRAPTGLTRALHTIAPLGLSDRRVVSEAVVLRVASAEQLAELKRFDEEAAAAEKSAQEIAKAFENPEVYAVHGPTRSSVPPIEPMPLRPRRREAMPGERPDAVTGHYLLGNGYRAFNPVLMRFHSPDNLSPFEKGGLNAYAYYLGDPVNKTDPTGHFP